jgi:hypothetical protein
LRKEELKNKPKNNFHRKEEEPEIISINKKISDIEISNVITADSRSQQQQQKEREEYNNNNNDDDDDDTKQVGKNVNGTIFLGPSEYLSANMKWEPIFGFIEDGHLYLYNDENMRDLKKY